MKRNKIYQIIVPLMMLAGTSCERFLDLSPISSETTGDAYQTASQIEAALAGVYESLTTDAYVWNDNIFADIRSDNYYAGGDNPEIFEVDNLQISPTNSKVLQSWSNAYNGILKANTVLYYLDGINDPALSDERRLKIKGEALFMRSYYYFSLVKLFGDVPLILNPTLSAKPEDVCVPRSAAIDVYTQILSDLDDAATYLPDVYGNNVSINKGRATAGAVNALAAKICAQKHDYTQCLEYITKVENSDANYELLNNYATLFDGNNYNNKESIFETQYLGGSDGNWGPQMLLPPSVSGDNWRKFMTPSHNLIDAYDAQGDNIRKSANILFEEVSWIDEFWGNAANTAVPFAYKYKDAGGWNSKDNKYLIRYADILLLKAEALNETNKPADALSVLNEVRDRVHLTALTTTDRATLKAAILNERRLELAQESHRWDDLVRNGVAVSTMSNLVEVDLSQGQAVNYTMTEAKIWLPIPQSELDRNPALTQNPL